MTEVAKRLRGRAEFDVVIRRGSRGAEQSIGDLAHELRYGVLRGAVKWCNRS